VSAFTPFGVDMFGEPIAKGGKLARSFIMPPFSVLDARSGDWQDRKRAWLSLGIKSEEGRTAQAYVSAQAASLAGGYTSDDGKLSATATSSVFDPTLCELAYSWWCPPGGQVVDPFAGGSVRGVVASKLGRPYWGGELRAEQVEANRRQASALCSEPLPVWEEGDSMETLDGAPGADFVFSCPPYGDLERYSDDERDLSTMDWHAFVAAYKRIVLRAVARMKPDSFACFVVGDFRDGKGHMRNFVAATTEAFVDAGTNLYNEAVLVTVAGTAGLRAPRIFSAGRKLVKTHQNVLVFVKGDWRKAGAKCREVAP
jgi:hypothetical protein